MRMQQPFPSLNSCEPGPQVYKESLSNIIADLEDRANIFEKNLASIFTLVFNVEKQLEGLKVALFR